VGISLLVEYYNALPNAAGEIVAAPRRRLETALEKFRQRIAGRYFEGTLQHLVESPDVRTRRAAVLALGLVGTMKSNAALAARLRDDDKVVRHMTIDALWALWFRADNEGNNRELQRLRQLPDNDAKRQGLDALVQKAPKFAEAFNQRAIFLFQKGELQKSIADCERVLKLNPCHFGAQAGMAQCYMRLGKARAALKAFRQALRLNPGLEGVEETIRALEEALGEEGRKSDER
jgi:tetratricopeptide (TPR) repeat protein